MENFSIVGYTGAFTSYKSIRRQHFTSTSPLHLQYFQVTHILVLSEPKINYNLKCVCNNYTPCIYRTVFMQVALHFSQVIKLLKIYVAKRERTQENTHKISFYIFREQENLLHFKTCYIISVLLFTTCRFFHNFIFFFCSNNIHVFQKP